MGKDIKILGREFPKWGVGVVVAGGAAAAYYAYRQKKNAAAAQSSSSSSIDPTTGLPYSMDDQTDPVTGETYLSEAQQYGSVAAAEQAYQAEQSGLYSTGAYGGSGGYYGDNGLSGIYSSDTASATTYASNAQWAQAVTAGLVNLGYAASDVTSALGLYLGSLPETAAQANIVQVALAEYGPPPSGSYQIVMAPSTTSTGSGTGTTTTTGGGTTTTTGGGTTTTTGGGTTTTTGGGTTTAQKSTVSGGHVVSVNNNDAVIAWTPHGPAKQWHVQITGPGAINGHTGTVDIPQASYSGLEAGHNYEVTVQPLPTGQSGVITFKTT